MEYTVLEGNELELIENVLNEDNMIFNSAFLKNFINNENAYGFVAKDEGSIIGFSYGYSLLRPDERTMFYVHSIRILSAYQDRGYGSSLLSFIKDYSTKIGCSMSKHKKSLSPVRIISTSETMAAFRIG